MEEGGVTKRDVPDTLWVGGVSRDSELTKDRAKFRAAFTNWMKPFNYEIMEFNFWPGFAWGTVQMRSAKQRNNLIEYAKTKHFSVGNDHFQVKSFERIVHDGGAKKKDKMSFERVKTASPQTKLNVSMNILKSKKKSPGGSNRGTPTSSRSATVSPLATNGQLSRRQQKAQQLNQQKKQLAKKQQEMRKREVASVNPFASLRQDDDTDEEDGLGNEQSIGRTSSRLSVPTSLTEWTDSEYGFSVDDSITGSPSFREPLSFFFDNNISGKRHDPDIWFSGDGGASALPPASSKSSSGSESPVLELSSRVPPQSPAAVTSAKNQPNIGSKKFIGDVRYHKGLVISCRKAGIDPSRRLEVRLLFCARKEETFFMSSSDLKNWTGSDPSVLVGEYIMAHFAGEGDGVFLYAELATTWEPAKSEAIEKAIRVLIDYFEYSYPLDSSTEFENFLDEIRAARDTKDISNIVRSKLSAAAGQFSSGDAAKDASEVATPKVGRAGKVEIFDDDNAPTDFGFESMSLGTTDVLMPLIPGNGDDYEAIFVLPDDDDSRSLNNRAKKEELQSAPKHSPIKLESETSTRSLTAAVPMREEESIRSEFKNWLATFYFGVDLDECDADAKSANVVSILVNAGLSLQLLIKEFRVNVDRKGGVLQLCKAISDLVEVNSSSLWLDVHPVLSFLFSKFFPGNVVPSCFNNLIHFATFQSSKWKNFYQVTGIVEEVKGEFALLCSEIGYVLCRKNQLPLSEVDVVGMMVSFCAWNARLLSNHVFPTYYAVFIVKCFDGGLDSFEGIRLPRFFDESEKRMMEQLLADKNTKDEPRKVFEKVVANLKRKTDRPSLESFLICRPLFETYSEMCSYISTSLTSQNHDKGGKKSKKLVDTKATEKSKLFVSVWARLGFTVQHLESDYRNLSHLGQRDLVEIVWLYLLNLVRLPKLINPFQLIEITISFFEDTIGKSSCNDFGAKIEEFALNRANIEDMMSAIQQGRRLPRPLMLPPLRNPPEELHPNVADFFQGFAQPTQQQVLHPIQQPQQLLPMQKSQPLMQLSQPHFMLSAQQPFQHQQFFMQQQQLLRPSHPIPLLGGPLLPDLRPKTNLQPNPGSMANHSKQPEVKIQSESGEVFKFALDADGNLSYDVVNAICAGTVALKYKLNDQTWRIITKSGNVFPQPKEGWADQVYITIGTQVPTRPQTHFPSSGWSY